MARLVSAGRDAGAETGTARAPIGARALYLWQGNKDTLYRLHGTNDPTTIGHNISSGCIRLTNDDVTDLYNRVTVGTKVIVLATANPAANPALTQ
jgi:lipoprotein-anchoring transpeptidase ErfK/SrfK